MAGDEAPKTSGAQAVYRALAILDAFDDVRSRLSAGELADALGLTVPTVHRIIHALTDRGFLERDEAAKTYRIGPSILRLARVASAGASAYELILPLVGELRDTWEETVGLHVRAGDRRVCIHELESPHRVRVVSGVGQSYSLASAAASKAMLAFTSPEDLLVLARTLPEVQQPALRAELEEIRDRGYAMSHGETIPGARAVAVPIIGPDGTAEAALNVTGPAHRLTEDLAETIGEALIARTRALRAAAGSAGGPA